MKRLLIFVVLALLISLTLACGCDPSQPGCGNPNPMVLLWLE